MDRLNTALPLTQRTSSSSRQPSLLHLLIVEDVPEDVELLIHALQLAGIQFTYDVVDSLAGCTACLNSQIYDVVLSDFRLPSMQAPQVLDLLHQSDQDLPFILVTGSLGEEAAVECIKAGMTDYVLKDRLFRLPTVVQRALSEWELRRQQRQAQQHIEQLAWRESIINRIVQTMRETLILDEVLQNTADQLQQALGISQCLILRPDPYQTMRVQYVSCATAQSLACDTATPYTQFFEQHLSHFWRPPHHLSMQILDRNQASEWQAILQRYELCSIMIAPLAYQQQYLGAICLHQSQGDLPALERQWTETEMTLVQAVADQCAIAIHQAELYQQAQKELEHRRRVEAQLRHDAFHDALTGLPNRALFIDRLGHALQLSQRRPLDERQRHPHDFAVLFLDLDDFKVINDSLGHYAGDQLLRIVAERLTSCLRTGDTLARLGGDEFAVLLEEIDSLDTVIDCVDDIQSILKLPILLDNNEVFINTSIGVVLNAGHYSQPSQFLRDADTAMYQAKNNGQGRYQVFDPSMHTEVSRRLKLESLLRRAIERQEMWVAYQPIVDLQTLHISGFEALLRWQTPAHGPVSPTEFVPIAEHTGLIIPIGLWVLQEACQQLKRWQEQFSTGHHLTMSINLSAKQFAQPGLIEYIDNVLQTNNLPGAALKLEVTESVLIDNEEIAAQTLQQFRDRAIQVCLDDFGTGYSSLSYLHRFPVDVLKIDRHFIAQIHTRSDNQEIVKAIIHLGIGLGLQVVAEGIEGREELTFLSNQSCHFGQGFWFSAPIAAEKAAALLTYYQETCNDLNFCVPSPPPNLTDHLP